MMIKIKNYKIFMVNDDCIYHWSKLPRFKAILLKNKIDLSEANLSWANLSWANLSEANLSRANLSWADLSGADLSGADLSGAYFTIKDTKYTISDFVVIYNLGSANRQTIFFNTDKGIYVYCGCYKGTLKAFNQRIKEVYTCSKYGRDYLAAIKFAKVRLKDFE